jgi:hypothetical protein
MIGIPNSNSTENKGDHRGSLVNNYAQIIRVLFAHATVNVVDLFKNKNPNSNLQAHDKLGILHCVIWDGESLKYEIEKNPSGHVACELEEFTCQTRSSDQDQLAKGNRFYKLAKDLLYGFVISTRFYFLASMKTLCSYSPKEIEPIRSVALTFLGIVTFILSGFTTGYAVNHILQGSSLPILSILNGEDGETLRVTISFICGALLSYVVLHLKNSIFRGILSEGKIFKGIGISFRRNPTSLLFAILMIFLSLKTNYDGGVALFSKSQYVNAQSRLIQSQTAAAFEPILDSDRTEVTSFFQSVLTIKQIAKSVVKEMERVTMDEEAGMASSGQSGHGPLYWGKSFVIKGGYDKDIHSVVNLSGQGLLAQRVDAIIQANNLQSHRSVGEKIYRLVDDYDNFVKNEHREVQKLLHKLDDKINAVDTLMPRFLNTAFVEYYDLDLILKQLGNHFSKIAIKYGNTIDLLESTIDRHVNVLNQIDRAGGVLVKNYEISFSFPTMNVSAISALTQGLPEVHHLSFSELVGLLKQKYGLLWTQIAMALIFMLAALIDLADLVFLAPFVARQGRRENELMVLKTEELNAWEEKFLTRSYLLFNGADVAKVFGRLLPANHLIFVNAFHELLGELNPNVIIPSDRPLNSRLWYNIKSDFTALHTFRAHIYNERVKAIKKIVKTPETHLTHYFNKLFPTLIEILDQPDFTFGEIERRVQNAQEQRIKKIMPRLYSSPEKLISQHFADSSILNTESINRDFPIKKVLKEAIGYNSDVELL